MLDVITAKADKTPSNKQEETPVPSPNQKLFLTVGQKKKLGKYFFEGFYRDPVVNTGVHIGVVISP